MKYAEKFKRATNNYSIKKLNICGIPLSVGLKNDIISSLSLSPKFCVKLYIYFRRTNQEPGKDAKGRNAG